MKDLRERLAAVRILVVGDAMVDVSFHGQVKRLAQEAPVPVFTVVNERRHGGGAANVFCQLRALGCQVFESFSERPRTHKVRYFHGQHLVFRVDEDELDVPTSREVAAAAAKIHGDDCQAVVISDYAKGWCSPEMCQTVIAEAQLRGVPVIVDPKGADWDKYAGATLICPNEAEWQAHMESSVRKSSEERRSRVLLKLGDKGVQLMNAGATAGGEVLCAQARHVYDVTGAGDTITAVMAAMLAVGEAPLQAARWANIAAGHVVGEVGTATCSIDKLLELVGG